MCYSAKWIKCLFYPFTSCYHEDVWQWWVLFTWNIYVWSSFFGSCEEKIKIIRTFYCCSYHEIVSLNVHSATSFSNKDCLHLLCLLSIYYFLGLILQILFSSVCIVRYSKITVFYVMQSICLLYLKWNMSAPRVHMGCFYLNWISQFSVNYESHHYLRQSGVNRSNFFFLEGDFMRMEQLFLVRKQICLLACCWDSMQLISGIVFMCFVISRSWKVLINQCIIENIVRFPW